MGDRSAMLAEFAMRPSVRGEHDDDEQDVEEEGGAYRAFARARGVKQFVPMLELRFCDGNRKAIEYSLLEKIDFDPSRGVTLSFSPYLVTVSGKNLLPLFAGLVRHSIQWIREAEGNQLFEM